MELAVDKNLIAFGNVLISVKGNMNRKIRYEILKLLKCCDPSGKL